MPLPPLSINGVLPAGRHYIINVDDIRTAFPATNVRRQSLEQELIHFIDVVRQFGLGSQLVIDGSYTTSKASPSDIDLALFSTGMSEAAMLRLLATEGVDLAALDVFVSTSLSDFEGWIQFFSVDRLQQARGVIILRL